MSRVLLVEDEVHTRERLARVIEQHPHLELIASVGSFAEGQAQLRHCPEVLLTDLGLPDESGLELIRAAVAQSPTTEIMVITVFGDEQHVIAAIKAGATGYLLKDDDDANIGDAVMQLLAGGSPISASIARYLLKRLHHDVTPPPVADAEVLAEQPTLTAREHEVLRLVAKGFSYNEIAEHLFISPHTVTSHVKKIYRKFAVGSRGEAVFAALQYGLLK